MCAFERARAWCTQALRIFKLVDLCYVSVYPLYHSGHICSIKSYIHSCMDPMQACQPHDTGITGQNLLLGDCTCIKRNSPIPLYTLLITFKNSDSQVHKGVSVVDRHGKVDLSSIVI